MTWSTRNSAKTQTKKVFWILNRKIIDLNDSFEDDLFLVFSMVLVESIKDTSQKITCSNYKRILSASLAIAKDLSLYQSTYKVDKPQNGWFWRSMAERSKLIDQGFFQYCCELSKTQSSNEDQRNILVQNCVESYIKYRKNSHLSLQLPNTESISKANRHKGKTNTSKDGL